MGYLTEVATWSAGIPYFEADAILTGGPDCPDNIPIQQLANRTAFLKKQIDDAVSGALTVMYANRLKSARNIAMTGDGSWNVTFDGNGNVTAAMTLANTAVVAGTYPVVTVDPKGRVTAGRALQSADLPANLALGGAPTAPTPAPGTNNTQIATAAFVQEAFAALIASSPAALDTLNELAAALGNDPNFSATITNALAGKVGKDVQGNVGIGVVPKTWDAMYPVLQVNAKSVLAADVNSTYHGTNWYRAGGVYKRLGSGHALMYHQDSAAGRHLWKTAPSDLVDSTVAWTTAMSLDVATGVLDVPAGITTATQVAGDSSTKAANTAFVQNATIGNGQTWQSFTPGAQRVVGTTYYNTTGKPIAVGIGWYMSASSLYYLYVNGVIVGEAGGNGAAAVRGQLFAIVPPGASYQFALSSGSLSIEYWAELR